MLCVLQTVFPLIYLLMKRHYEIMRVMRTKVLDPRELDPRSDSLVTVTEAIRLRMDDLTSTPSSISLAVSVAYMVNAHRYLSPTKT